MFNKYMGVGWGAERRMFLAFACLCDLKGKKEILAFGRIWKEVTYMWNAK